MSLKLITPPAGLVVSLVEARAHLRVDGTDDDTLITAMIGAATDHAEQMTGRALLPQTLELTLDAFPAEFELTRQPVTAITSIIYQSTAAALVTLSNTLYTLDASDDFGPAKVTPAYNTVWPDTLADVAAVKLRYVAGYANAAAVPEAIKIIGCIKRVERVRQGYKRRRRALVNDAGDRRNWLSSKFKLSRESVERQLQCL